jgi:hypothetical protein
MERTDKMHPLPWRHETDGKKMSAVVDANGNVVVGSLVCQQPDPEKERQTHAFIVRAVEYHTYHTRKEPVSEQLRRKSASRREKLKG